jgi:hypothetical protein
MDNRERFFECVCASNGEEARFFVRAWDAAEAEATARVLLRQAGIASARIKVGTPASARRSSAGFREPSPR